MNGKEYFLDTNIVVPLLNGDRSIVKRIGELDVIHLPIIVLGELYYGAAKSSRDKENKQGIDDFVLECRIHDIEETTSLCYGEIKAKLAVQGTPIPENDIWIAALVGENELPLVTRDKHFSHIPGLEIVVW